MWDFVDHVVYINLYRRSDRREHMEKMTSSFGEKVVRFSAIEDSPGYIGCTKSHIGALKLAISNNWKNVLILEDDAVWNDFDNGYERLEKLTSNMYDTILLGGTFLEYDANYRMTNGVSGVAYLVNNHYFQTLLNNLEEGLALFQKDIYNKEIYSLDRWWNQLQRRDNWYIVSPCLVYQLPSYSDIDNTMADSRCLYEMNHSIHPVKSRLTFQNIFRK